MKRQKNDAAEAIAGAAMRPTMRFVPLKSLEKQAATIVFRTRDVLLGQRTRNSSTPCAGHLSEYGVLAPQGPSNVERLIAEIEDPQSCVPADAWSCLGRACLGAPARQRQDGYARAAKSLRPPTATKRPSA